MKIELEASLGHWVAARLLDDRQAESIRQFEAEAQQHRTRWPVAIALAFGGLMLAAGVLLFVSAHWDQLSPVQRMTILVCTVTGFHVAGALVAERFRALGTTLHAVGSVSLGGAIALAGQIFHMQEHWPAAILLWAVGAAAGLWLLRDWPHVVLTAILVPWWLGGEWLDAASEPGAVFLLSSGILLLAICYLSARRLAADTPAHVALAWLGGIALLPAAMLAAMARPLLGNQVYPTPDLWVSGWALALVVPLGFAFAVRRSAAWMNVVGAMWVVGLHLLAQAQVETTALYGWCAIGAVGLVAWGVYEARPERINLGMAGFALTLAFFFFSSVMDRLGRSFSLIAMGVLFVAGGWYCEKLRRRLVAGLADGGVQ